MPGRVVSGETEPCPEAGLAFRLWAFDEISDFSESQYRFIIGWNRTTIEGQRCSAQWELTARGIKLAPKDAIRGRIGRSPGKGDAVVMAWAEGTKAVKRLLRANRPIEFQGAAGYNPHTGKYGR
jgi:hypothetical protein